MSEGQDSNRLSARQNEVLTLNNEPEKSVIEPTPREQPSSSHILHPSHSQDRQSEIQEISKEEKNEANASHSAFKQEVEPETFH